MYFSLKIITFIITNSQEFANFFIKMYKKVYCKKQLNLISLKDKQIA